jgi:hypothetical protein
LKKRKTSVARTKAPKQQQQKRNEILTPSLLFERISSENTVDKGEGKAQRKKAKNKSFLFRTVFRFAKKVKLI